MEYRKGEKHRCRFRSACTNNMNENEIGNNNVTYFFFIFTINKTVLFEIRDPVALCVARFGCIPSIEETRKTPTTLKTRKRGRSKKKIWRSEIFRWWGEVGVDMGGLRHLSREGHNSIMLPHYGPDLNSLTYPSSVLLYPLIPGLYDGDNRIAEAIFIQTVNFFRERPARIQKKRHERIRARALSPSRTHTNSRLL